MKSGIVVFALLLLSTVMPVISVGPIDSTSRIVRALIERDLAREKRVYDESDGYNPLWLSWKCLGLGGIFFRCK
ncbi:hypothetical protein L596_000266 [Steinernema carpocapsae]|uniref:Uncharacterized protein n=1 Tax=Steinernema carpocapsae TaxID=34508 RepID=A0A4U8UIR1_STECR|nr:hypothetical protein L596_000266 [Steinernema carpocapsae]